LQQLQRVAAAGQVVLDTGQHQGAAQSLGNAQQLRAAQPKQTQDAPIQGLRVGVYLLSIRGDLVFTSFDTDSAEQFNQFATRQAGRYVSRCQIPADFFNEGQYVLGINASSYRIKRYFQDEHALTFSIDSMGAPGKQWTEVRLGTIRPRLNWKIEEQA